MRPLRSAPAAPPQVSLAHSSMLKWAMLDTGSNRVTKISQHSDASSFPRGQRRSESGQNPGSRSPERGLDFGSAMADLRSIRTRLASNSFQPRHAPFFDKKHANHRSPRCFSLRSRIHLKISKLLLAQGSPSGLCTSRHRNEKANPSQGCEFSPWLLTTEKVDLLATFPCCRA